MICKSKLTVLSVVALLAISIYSGSAVAQYEQYGTQKTTNFTIDSTGSFTATETDIGVTYHIEGTPGATGSVTASIYSGNPQTSANVPEGVGLTKFIVITFDIDSNDFTTATITFGYTDSDLKNIEPPYMIYKYLPGANTYIEIPTTIDEQAKTMTITLTSTDDPLFAIGGSAVENTDDGSMTWIIVAAVAIIVVVVGVLLVIFLRKSGRL